MDLTLLTFFNQTLTHPLLDGVMMAVTIVGLALLPGLGILLFLSSTQRRIGVTIIASLVAGFVITLIFQYLAYRPRPETVRLLLASPNFPSYPSGHAVAAFGVAVVVGLAYRQWHWWGMALSGATLIAFSRVYLGHHYPSDIFGGAVLGASIGAICYGLFGLSSPDWRWLLWPQIAIVVIVTHMAYLDILPTRLLNWPLSDKVMHFLLFGAVVFWLNLWFNGRSVKLGHLALPLAILLPLSLAMLEEGAQVFSPLRSASLSDLGCDLMGMLFFWWLSGKIFTFDKYSVAEVKT